MISLLDNTRERECLCQQLQIGLAYIEGFKLFTTYTQCNKCKRESVCMCAPKQPDNTSYIGQYQLQKTINLGLIYENKLIYFHLYVSAIVNATPVNIFNETHSSFNGNLGVTYHFLQLWKNHCLLAKKIWLIDREGRGRGFKHGFNKSGKTLNQ